MAGGVQQLPRGRHGLPREEVLASQRGRILMAVAAAVADKGYAQTTVADVIARAGVSRETFYEQFGGKEDAFLAALDGAVDGLVWILRTAAEEGENIAPLERLDHLLEAYLATLAEAPEFAKAFLIDAYGAGAAATARRIGLQQRFVELVAGVLELDPGNAEDAFSCEVLVAAVSSLATSRIGTGREAELPALREPLIALARRLALGVAA
jgi:AcrR family transcriptional regulator